MKKSPAVKTKMIQHQPSWRVASSTVEAFITERGGHLAPVVFDRKGAAIAPFAIAPWAGEALPRETPQVLKSLRGDFFCMPFGGMSRPFRGEHHGLHGETANARWKFESLENGCLHLSLRTTVRPGRVDKRILLRDGHDAVYSQHVISGMSGPMTAGHHATLKFPDEGGVISTSPFVFGKVFDPFEKPAEGGYSALKPGAEFTSLEHVPALDGSEADLSLYPARRGFEDLAMIASAPAPFAWTAVTFARQRFVWFALKDPAVLPSTLFWITNGGRHYPPWNGRHVNVLGLEEVVTSPDIDLTKSAGKNAFSNRGIATVLKLHARRPTVINYIMAIAKIPAGFDRVAEIEAGDGAVILKSRGGKAVKAPLDAGFLKSGPSR